LRRIALGLPVEQFGDGGMVRDYLYVEDLVEMIAPMVGHDDAHSVYNLGSGHGHRVGEVLESLRRVTGVDFEIIERPVPATFVDRVVLNTTRYRREFGDHRVTPLDEGVRRTYEEIRSQV
jgi:UDP-glucose 4-epimerase